jgi:hypothetical protein
MLNSYYFRIDYLNDPIYELHKGKKYPMVDKNFPTPTNLSQSTTSAIFMDQLTGNGIK